MTSLRHEDREFELLAGDWGTSILRSADEEPFPEQLAWRLRETGWEPAEGSGGAVFTRLGILSLQRKTEVERLFAAANVGASQHLYKATLQSSGETHYLVLTSMDPAGHQGLGNVVRTEGLPMTVGKTVIRGKFSLELYNLVLGLFESELYISPELHSFAASSTSYAAVPSDLLQLGERVFGSVPGYQASSIGFLVARTRAILAAGPGTGKTAMSLMAAKHLGLPILVVCPLTLFDQWRRTSESLGVSIKISNPEGLERTMRVDTAAWENPNCVLIVDESSLYRNRKTKRYAMVKKLALPKKYAWALSGSPVVKSIDQLWAQLNLLDPSRWPSYWNFARRYCLIENNRWGTHIVGNRPGAEVRLRNNLQDIMLSYLSEDVITLPDWDIQSVNCRMGPLQQQAYKRAIRDLKIELELGENAPPTEIQERILQRIRSGDQAGRVVSDNSAFIFINSALAATTRSLQIASNPMLVGGENDSAKWDRCLDLTRKLARESQQTIIWFLYRTTGLELERRIDELGIRVARLDGGVSPAERKDRLEGFERGEIRVLLLHPGVAKFGLNLQRASAAIYVERNFDQEAFYQSMYRTKRMGSTTSTKVFFLLTTQEDGSPTIDSLVHKALSYQTLTMRKLMLKDLLQVFE